MISAADKARIAMIETTLTFIEEWKADAEAKGYIPTAELLIGDLRELLAKLQADDDADKEAGADK